MATNKEKQEAKDFLRNYLVDEAEYDIDEVESWDDYTLIDKYLHYNGIIGWTDDIIFITKILR